VVRRGATAQQRGGYCGTEQFNSRGSVSLCGIIAISALARRGSSEKSDFNFVTKCWQNHPRQLCGSALGKPARAAIWGFQIRDLQSLTGSTLQTSPLQPHNEIFYRFSQPLHFCRINTLALDGIRPNGARGALPGAARKVRDAAGPVDLPARDLAANDLAVRPVHQLSSERRRARE